MHKIFTTIAMVIIFFSSNFSFSVAYEKEIRTLSSAMAENIVKAGKKTVAVVDFVDLQGNVTELGRFIAEEFSVALVGSGKGFEVVERTQLKAILKEHKLVLTGAIDKATAKKLGQIVGADALITGTITPFGDSVRLAVKILGTDTGKVIGASSGDIPKTKAIEELLGKGIESTSLTGRESVTTSSVPSGKAVEASGFILSPVKCFRTGDVVQCTISFQNATNEEVKLSIGPRPSHLIDNRGNQYPVTVAIGKRHQNYSDIEETFLPQVSINVHFLSNDVVPDATHMTAVISISRPESRRIGGGARPAPRPKLVAVRNIPITK